MGKDTPGKLRQKDIDRLIEAQINANRVNQVTPLGNLTYRGNTATVELSPEQQRILEQQQIAQLLATETAGGTLGDLAAGREAAERATFDRALSLLNPVLERREEQLRQRLANQGLPQTSRAFRDELTRFDTDVNEQLERLALSAVLAGDQAQTASVNRALALLGGGQALFPTFINVPQVDVPFNQPQARQSDPLSLILGLGGAGVGGYFGGPAGAAAGFQIGTGSGRVAQGY